MYLCYFPVFYLQDIRIQALMEISEIVAVVLIYYDIFHIVQLDTFHLPFQNLLRGNVRENEQHRSILTVLAEESLRLRDASRAPRLGNQYDCRIGRQILKHGNGIGNDRLVRSTGR